MPLETFCELADGEDGSGDDAGGGGGGVFVLDTSALDDGEFGALVCDALLRAIAGDRVMACRARVSRSQGCLLFATTTSLTLTVLLSAVAPRDRLD